ncbi:putative endonuclease [Ancylomarina subtilis]|uniref:Putative endonuclease n=1 Tax=Ancylomarina subtilis TaxID=1639035 RepID=A0A4Q7V918_9BACT|nr:GIY-YIG nuclease family protein [Ancylomarina subtilis]RZT92364.1 putative endonuclease [Ancylomarina subtilis]
MAYCYILHSKSLDRYYYGSTELEPSERLELHLQSYYGNKKFTAKANDWKLVLAISCESISQARRIEAFIKKMKSKKYVITLISNREKVDWLLENV